MKRKLRNARACLLVALLAITLAPRGNSQTTATAEVTGKALDPSNAVIVGATVLLKSVDTGEPREVNTDAYGTYRFTFLKPGAYQISGTSKGLKSDIGNMVANVGHVQVVNLHLKVQEAREVFVVSDEAPLVDTDNANIVNTLSSRQLDLLPLPGGDLVSIAHSTPGVVLNNRYGVGNFVVQGVGTTSNLFTVNGIDNMDPYSNLNNSGTTGLLLGANEVQEASIIQNAYDGEYGRQAGAQVNFVTRSGTNSFHGNLAYNFNGARFNANEFFSNATGTPRPNLISNQYAVAIGGPVLKDKLFFFFDTEGLRFSVPKPIAVVVVPTLALENYTLGKIQAAQIPLYQSMFRLFDGASGHDRAVPVSTGTGLLQDASGRLGCGTLSSTPTGTGGTFGVDVSCAQAWARDIHPPTSEWLLSSRADYNVNASQRMFFRFRTDHGFLPDITSAISPAFNAISVQPDYEGQVGHTIVIAPQLVNNFIGAVTYNDYVFKIADLPAALKAMPFRVNFNNGGANGGSIAALGSPAAYPLGRRAGQLQIADNVAFEAGRHSMKAGINYRYNRESDLATARFVSSGVYNLSSLKGFATGVLDGASTYRQNFTADPVHNMRLYSLGVYVQDEWSVHLHLKLSATIRIERNGNPSCVERCFSRLASPFAEMNKDSSIPYNQSIQTGLAHAFYQVEPLVFQPRFGLAYTPSWVRDTVFRGGIGLFSDSYPASFAGLMGTNAPNVFSSVVRTGIIDSAGAGSAPAIAAAAATAFDSQFASGATLPQLQQAVAPAPFAPPGYFSVPAKLRNPRYVEWSIEVQHKVGTHNALTVRYMGNHGYDIFLYNPNLNGSAPQSSYPNGFGGLPGETPDDRFGVISQFTNTGCSNYHSLAIVYRRALRNGLQGQASYTWSHALDTTSNGGLSDFSYDSQDGQINPANLRSLNYSNADYDVRHNVTGDLTWQIPVRLSSRSLNAVLGGWSVAARVNGHTGTPFSITNFNGGALLAGIGGSILADVTDPNIKRSCGRSGVRTPCFTANEFNASSQSDFGNMPRNSFRGPGFVNVDSSIYKTVHISEGLQFTVGASAYNLFNHSNFADPNADASSSGLGLITFSASSLGGPYGLSGSHSARMVVITGKLRF